MGQTDNQTPKADITDLSAEEHQPEIVDEDPSVLARAETVRGKFPGQERVRIIRPSRASFRQVEPGLIEATEESAPRKGAGKFFFNLKRTLIGAPIATAQAEHERLTKVKALAVLSSDAISSVAYATEAGLGVLILAGTSALNLILPISVAIVALLGIVALSYSQTIPAYPNGGGSYIVAKDNLGTMAGLIAAASLLIDYVLTVSVSVSSGVQNLISIPQFAGLNAYLVPIDVLLIVLITMVNLRGVRESGSIFAIPTYIFIVCALFLIILGLFEAYILWHQPLISTFHPPAGQPAPGVLESISAFLILRAFASGCSAMTGVEAISNGVPAFHKPEPRNARTTLLWMAGILGTLFIGITLLTLTFGIEPSPTGNPTVIAQVAQRVFIGPISFMTYVFQIAILLILVLAANTSYSDFPRLSSLLARDHFLPHQFAFRGDRLAFSTGIIVLAVLSSLLIILFHGSTDLLINLYAVGVFLSFTLSQAGMVLHWWRLRAEHKGWLRSMLINGLGAVTTALVAIIIAYTKFTSGAWIVVIVIPMLVLMFLAIHTHYSKVERERTTNIPSRPADIKHLFVVPIAGMDRVSIQSLAYARSISSHVIAVHVAIDMDDARAVREAWGRWLPNIDKDEKTELVIIESPYRSLTRPLLNYIDTVHELYPDYTLTVLLPEFIVAHWWEHFLHNQTALALKASLLFRPGIVVTSVPQHLPERTSAAN